MRGQETRAQQVVTVHELGLNETDDEVLLTEATRQGRLMLSCDADFLTIHDEWLRTARPHAGIVYWPQSRAIGEAIRRIFQFVASTDSDQAVNNVKFLRRSPKRLEVPETGRCHCVGCHWRQL